MTNDASLWWGSMPTSSVSDRLLDCHEAKHKTKNKEQKHRSLCFHFGVCPDVRLFPHTSRLQHAKAKAPFTDPGAIAVSPLLPPDFLC